MHSRLCPTIFVLITLLALSACSSPALPQISNAPTPKPSTTPTAQAPTRTPARPTLQTAATSQPTAIRPTAVALPPTPPPDPKPPTAIARMGVPAVVTNGGNVRDTPVTGTILDQVNAHETVQLLQKNGAGTWYLLVTPRDVTGWVSATLLRIDPAVAALIPVVAEAVPSPPLAGFAAPIDWTTHTIGQSTLHIPSSWQSVPLTKAAIEQAATALEPQNPSLAQIVRQLVASGLYTQITFFAIGANPAGNVNVIETPRPAGMTTDTLLAQLLAQVPTLLPNTTIISSDDKHQVNGLPAARIMYDLVVNNPAGTAETIRGDMCESARMRVGHPSGVRDKKIVGTACVTIV